MYENSGDYLMMYDTAHNEEHNDSSDFDTPVQPRISKKKGNHSLLNHKKIPVKGINDPRYQKKNYDYEYPVKLKREQSNQTWTNEARIQDVKTNHYTRKGKQKSKNFNNGDPPEQTQSKLALLRQKVMPRLSSIFRRSQTKRENMTAIEENNEKRTKDIGCTSCPKCEQKRLKTMYKTQQSYAVQPVYTIEGNIHKNQTPFSLKNNMKPQKKHNSKKSKIQGSSCSISSSSESETLINNTIKQNKLKMRKIIKKEIMKEQIIYNQNHRFKNQQHQYPSKENRIPYQVYTTPFQQTSASLSPSNSQCLSEMPSTSSFWEYLYDRINRKYMVQKLEIPNPKPCKCGKDEPLPCSPDDCEDLKPLQNECNFYKQQKRQQGALEGSCTCPNSKRKPQKSGYCQNKSIGTPENLMDRPQSMTSRHSIDSKKANPQEKVECECFDPPNDKPSKQSKTTLKSPSMAPNTSTQGGTPMKPCQEGHDEITATLADMYKGEILCIHNPPCILINGCLNLPQPKEPANQINLWPVTETKKSKFYTKKKANKQKNQCEQACQYHIPCVEIRQCQIPNTKNEKNVQSICHHDPPCEVVRGCFKPKYDPQLQTSCVHVPMCLKIPECLVGQRVAGRSSCEHRPRCPEIPLCSRNYTTLTAKSNFGAQVKPVPKLVCRHIPPCIMVPKCFGRAFCANQTHCEAIPDCIHQPPCEMVPACCRTSNREMVSVSSQYPNCCRIV